MGSLQILRFQLTLSKAMSHKSLRWIFLAVAKVAGISVNKVEMDSFLEDLGIDSLGLLQLLMHIDEETAITLDDKEIAKLETVADIFYCLNRKGFAV